MTNVFIIGARGYSKKYGGWESLIHGLIDNKISQFIHYYVYEVVHDEKEAGIIEVDGITCIKLFISYNGNASMMLFDAKASFHVLRYIKKNNIPNPVVLYLGLRIGPLIYLQRPFFKYHGIVMMDNPAGLEWKRPKWGKLFQIYAQISAYFTARAVDYLVCDAEGIRDVYNKFVKTKRPKKVYIAYGSYEAPQLNIKVPDKVRMYFREHDIIPGDYYLIVNRFMPENSYELILREYVNSNTKRQLVLVTNIDKEHEYYHKLATQIPFEQDTRIKFVGTMYDSEILEYLRQNAFAYINGHTLGGTNPGLLEAMASSGIILAYDTVFSREVCSNLAIYYNEEYTLCKAMESCERMTPQERNDQIVAARLRMKQKYSWVSITAQYEELFKKSVEVNKNRWKVGVKLL